MMRAFVVDGPGSGQVLEVESVAPADDEVLVEVASVGLCGTDVELFAGSMPYFSLGLTRYPVRPGHEWSGVVKAIGRDVGNLAVGDAVVGDTFIGCDNCELCTAGRHHLCPDHVELGVRGNRAGALAEELVLPARAVHRLPEGISLRAAAFVEPASCALRGISVAGVGPRSNTLVWGTGTIGVLAAQYAREAGSEVTVVVRRHADVDRLRSVGLTSTLTFDEVDGDGRFDCVIDATGASDVPSKALSNVAAGGRLVLLGVPPGQSDLDVATLVLGDITVFGVLGGSAYIDHAARLIAEGAIVVDPLISAVIALDEVAATLRAGGRIEGSTGSKVLVDPKLP